MTLPVLVETVEAVDIRHKAYSGEIGRTKEMIPIKGNHRVIQK